MQALQRILDFYIFGSIHVGLATFSLVKITLLLYQNERNTVPFFVFFATILSYNFIRFYRRKTIKGFFADFLKMYQPAIVIISVISLLGMSYFGLQLQLYEILSLVPFFVLTIFYVLPITRKSTLQRSLRTISGIKIIVIAVCWAGVTVLVPLVHLKIPISFEVVGLFLQRFFFVLAITIPFDVRDLSHDSSNLKTIPQLVGVSNAKRFGLLLLILFLGLSLWLHAQDTLLLRIEFLIAFISLLFLVRSSEHQHKYYSTFFVESIPILWLGLVYFLRP